MFSPAGQEPALSKRRHSRNSSNGDLACRKDAQGRLFAPPEQRLRSDVMKTKSVPPRVEYVLEAQALKKHKQVAPVALARKLLIAVYALLHDGVGFDEEKFAAR